MKHVFDFYGEFIGTFILVFFGCGAVAVTVLFSSHVGLFQLASIWGLAVTLAIYATRNLSCAHLNPAVSLAMVLGGRMSASKLIRYMLAQFTGAIFAAFALYIIFSSSITYFEQVHGIVRGEPGSVATAVIFSQYYPSPSAGQFLQITMLNAFLVEALGTFILVFMIFALTDGCNIGRPDDKLAPVFIGLTLTMIISILAPLTMAGLNPARDLSPRLFAYLAGWGNAAFPEPAYGIIIVYVLGPIIGAVASAFFFSKLIQPAMTQKNLEVSCSCGSREEIMKNP
ncbi:MIP/aquaporin family protein [Candidatus Contubernalis alkaliaceticus]|uniref:MIP/aquaporin family protein n=1 Tax=Candidatus Contubernalis alkaliaceticus TaxID=338645 RepID=UPI001F4C0578|nr:MIP/aquaporin family protein [Candidatus Contubernalis alkalaceticus]UNC91591.1 aquaporin family protein [Candidatus Contubernalis alkalaceticus]